MFRRKLDKARTKAVFASYTTSPFSFEGLEDRRLMSGGGHHGFGGHGGLGGGFGGHSGGTITYAEAPSAVQSGLTSLAGTDGVTAPTSATTVQLGNSNGVETYTVDVQGTGTDTRLTVDASGNPVTAPTRTTTTFGAVSNAAVTSEITAIASALGLTAPTSSTSVSVVTPASGAATYSVTLSSSSSTSSRSRGTTITVDANGNPVGNERVSLSTLSTAIQNGLTSNAPSGATALAASSLINVQTLNGVTTYTATYSGTGTRTTVTVNSSGALANLPSTSSTVFSSIPSAAQTELQALATDDGAGAIATTQSVSAYDEGNGTTLYTVRLTATDSTTGNTYPITLTVDENGNPTVLPNGGGGQGGHGGGGGDCGPVGTGTTTGSTGTVTSARHKRG